MPRLKVLAVLAAAAAFAAPAAQANDETNQDHRRVTVMTQNLFLGADLNPIFRATSLFGLFGAVGAAWNSVQANDFPARAQVLADEIAAARPDLVGLQEATLYRTDVPPDGRATPAETVAYDYLQLLVDALAERGLTYEPVSVFTGGDDELPAGLPPQLDVRITDRVVVLARTSGGPTVHVSNPQFGTYPTALTVQTVAGPITLPRGWASVDVKVRGDRFRFVSTHLEAFTPLIRNPQAAELLNGPAATDLPLVVVGDFNSGPGTDLTAYGILTGGGLADAWPDGPVTCCHAPNLHLDTPLTKRVDLVWTRGGFSTAAADVVGEEPADRTPSGLWPSDHAGVVATLQLP
jgi:endonuclease/exonuclease/phosphatase family metal-dependent hydrolase